MTQYIDPNYQQPRPEPRSRQASTASMKYVPESYGGPPAVQPPPPPQGYFDAARPRGPSFGNQPVPSFPPQPNPYAPAPAVYTPNARLHPSYTPGGPPQPQYPTNVDQDGYMQPPAAPRRHSHSSQHSQQSHYSHHSRKSHDSRRSKHSTHSSGRDRRSSEGGERRRSRDSRRSQGERDMAPVKRVKTHRPSWGDSIYSVFSVIKDALGPRDKY
jgi:hypothetical protein